MGRQEVDGQGSLSKFMVEDGHVCVRATQAPR